MKREIKSIVTDDTHHCYIHKKFLGIEVNADHEHHMIHGENRKIADEHHLVCGICESCHRLLHDMGYHDLDLQQDAERAWLEYNNKSIRDWVAVFGKNYLNEHW